MVADWLDERLRQPRSLVKAVQNPFVPDTSSYCWKGGLGQQGDIDSSECMTGYINVLACQVQWKKRAGIRRRKLLKRWWARKDSSLRPMDYESTALFLSGSQKSDKFNTFKHLNPALACPERTERDRKVLQLGTFRYSDK